MLATASFCFLLVLGTGAGGGQKLLHVITSFPLTSEPCGGPSPKPVLSGVAFWITASPLEKAPHYFQVQKPGMETGYTTSCFMWASGHSEGLWGACLPAEWSQVVLCHRIRRLDLALSVYGASSECVLGSGELCVPYNLFCSRLLSLWFALNLEFSFSFWVLLLQVSRTSSKPTRRCCPFETKILMWGL